MRILALLVCTLAAVACVDEENAASGSEGVRVVASFYPLAEVATRLVDGRGDVHNLTPAGAEPHDFELSPREVERLHDADLVLVLGGDFQPAVEDVAEQVDGDVVSVLAAQPAPEDDPHVWLDPRRMRGIVDLAVEALERVDPDGSEDYQRNAARYLAEIDDLDRRMTRGLADCEREIIVTTHAAFGHLARRFGLVQEAITGLSPESEPAPGRLAELSDTLGSTEVTTVFYERLVSARVACALACEAGVETAVLDPVEGLSGDDLEAGKDYRALMLENLAALREALGCR